MLKFGNKEFRNLQEQVFKNMQDIKNMTEGTAVLSEFGIKVVGEVATEAELPTVEEYKTAHSDWEYGDAFAIGTTAPYTLVILTRANEEIEADHWFDIGEFPAPGPQGAQGPQGEVGPQGQTGQAGADGTDAGFGTVSATAQTLVAGSPATVSVTASGPNTAKEFSFTFGIPRGADGQSVSAAWGTITGTLSDQTDLQNALNSKQNTLVSGTNIKTINNTSILGSGNINISGSSDCSILLNGVTYTQSSTGVITLPDLIETPVWNLNFTDLPGGTDVVAAITGNSTANRGQLTLDTYGTAPVYMILGGDQSNQIKIGGVSSLYSDTTNYTDLGRSNAYFKDLYLAGNLKASGKSVSIASIVDGLASIPTKTSDLTNDSGFITSAALPTKTSDLTNDSGFITSSALTPYALISSLATVATSGSYNDLSNKPTIPTKTSDLTNDSYFITNVNPYLYIGPVGSSTISNDICGYINSYTASTAEEVTQSLKLTGGQYVYDSSNPTIYLDAITSTGTGTIFRRIRLEADEILPDLDQYKQVNLGNATTRFNNLYLKGSLSDGTNSIAIANIASKSEIPTVPTTVSSFTNDAGYITGITSSMITNALGYTPGTSNFSGDYDDLTDKPTIPTISGTNDGTNWTSITINNATYAIPQGGGTGTVTDVTLGGTSVVSSGVAVLPAYPTVPTTVSSFTNDAGYQTAANVATAIAGQTKETWTFTLSNGTTTTKTIVLG